MLRQPRVLVFAGSLFLFQLGSIAVLQLAAATMTARIGTHAGLVIAAFVIVPQAIVALAAPSIGAWAESHGRRRVLVAGFATVPLRALGFALTAQPVTLVIVQVLEGIGGAVLGVLMPLIAADVTRGTRRYTLCLAVFGLAGTGGTAVSTVLAGFVADRFGITAAFLVLAAAGLAGALLLAAAMPETRVAPGALAISPRRQNAAAKPE
jgi:MFS family permease